ncbi:MAG: hypothetical protein ACE5JR_06305 [Gemmatimonadota bacterium]
MGLLRGSTATLVLLLAADVAWGQVVESFRGHTWGTHRSAIPELAEADAREAPNGMTAYGIEAKLLGYAGTAFFLFDPDSDELLEGIYIFPLETENCTRAWTDFEKALAEEFPSLRIERFKDDWDEKQQRIYDSFCEFYVFNAKSKNWITRFRNADTELVEVGMAMGVQGLRPRLNILYLSEEAVSWDGKREEETASLEDRGP